MWYDARDVILAWDAFITAAQTDPSLSDASNFRHDLVDLSRQSMQEIFDRLYNKLLIVYCEKNTTALAYRFSFFISHVFLITSAMLIERLLAN